MADIKNLKSAEDLAKENQLLKAKVVELSGIIGADYVPCEGCGNPTYMELLTKVKSYENRGNTPIVAIAPTNPKGYKWADSLPFASNFEGQVISKQAVTDLLSGKKVAIETLDNRVQMEAYFLSDGSANKDTLPLLVTFLTEKEVLLKA